MKQLLLALILVAMPAVARAQSADDTTNALARLQRQIDQLQAQLRLPDPQLYGSTDAVALVGPFLWVSGWAFECGTDRTEQVEIEIDGVIREGGIITRFDRPDVVEWASRTRHCPGKMPAQSGVLAVVNMATFNLEAPHTVAIRLRNAAGVSQRFNVRPFNVCGFRRDGSYFCL